MRAAWLLAIVGATTGALLQGCPSIPSECDNGACEPGADASTRDGGEKIVVPEGCDVAADPHSAPACSVDSYVVYVSASAKDNNEGTRAKPVKTIAKAMTLVGKNRPRVYVCAGEYAEAVKLTPGIVLAGGFDCTSWEKGGETHVAPSERGEALRIEDTDGPSGVWDMRFTAKDGVDPGESSVAGVVSKSAPVTFTRVTFEAGKGVDGKKGDDGAAGEAGEKGNDASGVTGGAAKTCACAIGGQSVGGAGGSKGGAGSDGQPALTSAPAGGKGGAAGGDPCTFGTPGASTPGGKGGDGAQLPATWVDGLWKTSAGSDGERAAIAQGGGGSGGSSSLGSGGGGCGGCSGGAGRGGLSGGSSVALLVSEATVVLASSSLRASVAGNGLAGGAGGAGGGGGGGTSGACGGREGGNAGGSGGGGGGAGGMSIGVVSKAANVTLDEETTNGIRVGVAGSGGGGGNGAPGGTSSANVTVAPSGSSGTAGSNGISQPIYELK